MRYILAAFVLVASAACAGSEDGVTFPRIEDGKTARCTSIEGCIVVGTGTLAQTMRNAFEAGRKSCRGAM